jgi:CRISPR-associated protein Cas5d
MSLTVRLHVSGDLACFTRPETKVERSSYPLPTPSAARNILDSILWKPEMRWIVDRILLVRHPRAPVGASPALPATLAIRRNELQSVVAPGTVSAWIRKPDTYLPQAAGAGEGTDATPRVTMALKNVAYVIEAHPHVFVPVGMDGQINTPRKYVEVFERRAAKGQCRHQPYLGCREFAAEFRPATDDDTPLDVTEDLGRMLYDIVFSDDKGRRPVFFAARLQQGVLDTRPETVLATESVRAEVLACSYKR